EANYPKLAADCLGHVLTRTRFAPPAFTPTRMPQRKLGLWLIGAKGGVATTVVVGLVALRKGLTDQQGLVSALPRFAALDFAGWNDFTIGGHEIRETTYFAAAQQLARNNHALDGELISKLKTDLDKLDKNVRPGTLLNVGAAIEGIAAPGATRVRESPRAAIERVQNDLKDFANKNRLDQVVVVNLASTEPPLESVLPMRWKELARLLEKKKC